MCWRYKTDLGRFNMKAANYRTGLQDCEAESKSSSHKTWGLNLVAVSLDAAVTVSMRRFLENT